MGLRRLRIGRAVAAALLAVAALLGAGCLEPFQARVDPSVLARSQLGWQETLHPMVGEDEGLLGTKQWQADYDIPRGGRSPPAHLEVYSLRSASSPGVDALLNLTRQELEEYAQRTGLAVDARYDMQGSRSWASGLHTKWLAREGRVTGTGLFTHDYKVRLVAEVAFDGRSSTSIVALGAAQVEAARQCPVIGACQPSADDRSWVEMVGDPSGALRSARSDHGLLYNLVTH